MTNDTCRFWDGQFKSIYRGQKLNLTTVKSFKNSGDLNTCLNPINGVVWGINSTLRRPQQNYPENLGQKSKQQWLRIPKFSST